ncbi:MAG: helix-turn-helix domain-containing protein [Marinifilaceae bacterium]|nr:helix-turn-helix domain-containing protein [Marinifilaceae bacterium]
MVPFLMITVGDFSMTIYNNAAPILNGEDYLCDKEVSQLLKVSRRTLSDYRSNGTLPYYVLGGKVLYKRSEIEEVLRQGYRDASRMKGGG